MSRPEITGRKSHGPRTKAGKRRAELRERLRQTTPPAAYTISTFCAAHHISESFYHKLKNLGLAPREMHVEDRTLISFESAADWRRNHEVATEREEASSM